MSWAPSPAYLITLSLKRMPRIEASNETIVFILCDRGQQKIITSKTGLKAGCLLSGSLGS